MESSAGSSYQKEEYQSPSLDLSVCAPIEVVQLIMQKLPLPDILRLRLVCRSWNGLLSSPAFLCLCFSAHHHVYWLTQTASHAPCDPPPSHSRDSSQFPSQSLFLREDDHRLWRLCQQPVQHELNLLLLCTNAQKQDSTPLPRHRFHLDSLKGVMDGGCHSYLGELHPGHAGVITCSVPCRRHLSAGKGGLVVELAFYCTNVRLQPRTIPLIRVFNILTGCYRKLPPPSYQNCLLAASNSIFSSNLRRREVQYELYFTGYKLNSRFSGGYNLHILASNDDSYYHLVIDRSSDVFAHAIQLHVYDSRCLDSWRLVCGPRYRHLISSHDEQCLQQANCGDDIFAGDLFFPVASKNLLLSYRVETDEWSKVSIVGQFPSECNESEPTVMKLEGPRVLMAVHLSTNDQLRRIFTLSGFAVWELQKYVTFLEDSNSVSELQVCMYSWVEVARTPPNFSFVYRLLDLPRFLHSSTMICMTGEYCKQAGVDRSGIEYIFGGNPRSVTGYLRPLAYDVKRGCWFFMPFEWINSQELLVLSSFQPSFPGIDP